MPSWDSSLSGVSFAIGMLAVAWFFPAAAAIEVALSSSGRAVGMGSSLPHSAEDVVRVPPGVSVASEDSPESPPWTASDRARRQEMRELIREASDAGGQYSAATQEEEHQRSGLAAVQVTALHASEGETSTVRAEARAAHVHAAGWPLYWISLDPVFVSLLARLHRT